MFRKSTISKLVLIALSMVVVSPLAALAQVSSDSTGGASCPAPGGDQGAGGGRRGHRGMRGGKGGNVDPARRQAMKAKMMAKFDKTAMASSTTTKKRLCSSLDRSVKPVELPCKTAATLVQLG